MIKELIKLANHLDSKGLAKEADVIDGIITKVHGKGPEEPVDLIPEEYTNLGATNITHDEAFSAGCSVCGDTTNSCGHKSESYMARPQLYKIQEYAAKLHDMIQDGETLDDWMESHIAKMDQMIGAVYHKYNYKSNKM